LARAAQKHDEAARLYAEVAAQVPQFDHALRRQAAEEMFLGRKELAITHAKQALSIDRSAENLATLAAALISSKPTPDQLQDGKHLANESAKMKPNEPFVHSVLAQAAIDSDDLDALRRETLRLEMLAPNEVETQMCRVTLAAADGAWSGALEALEKAHKLGLSDADYNDMKQKLHSAMPFYLRWGKPVALSVGVWFGGFAVLLLAGAILSWIAMHAARRQPQHIAQNATPLSSGVRRTYGAVLFLSSIFYYLSIPIVIAIVLAAGGGLIYACFALGRIPIKLVIGVVVIVGVTVVSMIKSLFMRREDEDPGMKLDLTRQPRLRALLDDVARRIGTRTVENVYLTPGTEVAVMQRGKRGRERCLILGIAALDGLKVRPLKAVLGHEYGHFTNRDTAGGAFALSVRNSLRATAIGLAQGGAAHWYNPAWLFVNAFHRVFLRISQGASRLQEVLADRWAVFAYGAEAFEQGLRHVIERSVRFDAHVGATLNEVVNQQRPLANLYTYQPAERTKEEDIAQAIEEALTRKASAYDSHPPAAERFAIARALPNRSRRMEPDDDAPAWSLFDNPLDLQQQMTTQVRANVAANYGVSITAA
ncbi:MAG TPA: M48 family metallopeptidase, partial [Thermoanaerobaculia bacterium]|nr:M48 family metallopeptidase [Thermoanaerobaculia bacterium]